MVISLRYKWGLSINMKITKSERRTRYLAEQKTPDGTIVGFGNSAIEAIKEALCKICGNSLSCARCLGARGARITNAKLTPQERVMSARKAISARWRPVHARAGEQREEKGRAVEDNQKKHE